MEMRILKALYKLAKDILDSGPGSQIRLDESLFSSQDTNKISFTIKNYNRPNGVATQIFETKLLGYEKSLEAENFLIATQQSSNRNLLMSLIPKGVYNSNYQS